MTRTIIGLALSLVTFASYGSVISLTSKCTDLANKTVPPDKCSTINLTAFESMIHENDTFNVNWTF